MAATGDPSEVAKVPCTSSRTISYDFIPRDKHLALANEFVGSDAPSIAGIYSYLHEAMAIAAQGLYEDTKERGGSREEDEGDTEYKHPYIPVLASVAAPLVKAAVARNGTWSAGSQSRTLPASYPH
jgi:hypothetical protein